MLLTSLKKSLKKTLVQTEGGEGGGLGRVWTKSKLAFFLIFEPFPYSIAGGGWKINSILADVGKIYS